MAKLTLRFTPYQRRDPVTGAVGEYVRTATARQTSRRLKEFQACVRQGMLGFRPAGATPAERARSIRQEFGRVAAQCSRGGMVTPPASPVQAAPARPRRRRAATQA